jgi:hypothetical protein
VRVLFDTNVLVSGILFGGTPRSLMRAAIRGEIDLVTSPHLLSELKELLERKFGFSAASAAAIRQELESLADVVIAEHVPRVCRDPDDDEVLAAALQGRATAIVTGDADLLVLAAHGGIEIIDPATLAARLAS